MRTLATAAFAAIIGIAAPCQAQQIAEPISIEDEIYFGVRSIPGFDIEGKYLYESEGEPRAELHSSGSGCFARHQRPCQPLTWWILAEADGNPKTLKGAIGQQHTLIFQYEDGKFDMAMFTIRYDTKQMIILGERIKPY